MAAELILAGFGAIAGLGLLLVGLAGVSAGKGGYGHGPFPMVPVPRDNGLIVIGLTLAVVGWILLAAAIEVLA